jgi:hypothetical protein|tara:strand:- start:50 stop:271 length:222 start_codon:yes stop_codon:yes gene_type:complete
MGLLRYRETGRVLTEKEFRYETRKRRPQTVPAQGLLTEVFLDSEGIDPVLNSPGSGEVTGAEQLNGKWFTTRS